MPIVWTLLPSTPLAESPASGACCDCCTNTLDLGCFNYCDRFSLKGVNAPIAGYYSFVFQTPAGLRTIKVYLQVGENLSSAIPFEYGDSTFYILDTNGDQIEIQAVETITDVCGVSTDITTIYDCFRVTAKIEAETAYENIPCVGNETVTIERIARASRKGAQMAEFVLIDVPNLFVLNNAHFEIYRLYYSPINGCILAGDIAIAIDNPDYTVANIIHVTEPSAPLGLPYIQFELSNVTSGTVINQIILTITGLCNGCALPVFYSANAVKFDCADPNGFLFGLLKQNEILPDPYIVPEDLSFEDLLLITFRQCCTEDITVDIEIISSTSNDFTLPSSLVIPATDADIPIRVNYPEGAFNAQIQVTLSGCSIITVFYQTFERA